jgi:hypothetical protein
MLSIAHCVLCLWDAQQPFFHPSADERRASEWMGRGGWADVDGQRRVWYALMLIEVIAYAAMVMLQDWGRWVALIAFLGWIIVPPIFGLQVIPWRRALLYNVGTSASALTLAVAFLTPIALRFTGEIVDESPNDASADEYEEI